MRIYTRTAKQRIILCEPDKIGCFSSSNGFSRCYTCRLDSNFAYSEKDDFDQAVIHFGKNDVKPSDTSIYRRLAFHSPQCRDMMKSNNLTADLAPPVEITSGVNSLINKPASYARATMHSIDNEKPFVDEWGPLLKKIAADQDRVAFEKLFDHFAPKIKSYGMMMKSQHTSAQMAEELVQDVMLKVWLKAHCFDSEKASASTWIFTIARNCRTDFIRKAHRTDTPLIADDLWPMAEEIEPFTSLHQHRIEKNIHNAVAQLPSEQADVLKRIYIEGKSHSEVAETTGIPLGTVKSRVRLAVAKLRTLL